MRPRARLPDPLHHLPDPLRHFLDSVYCGLSVGLEVEEEV